MYKRQSALSLLLLNTAHAGKLYKWVDANGRVSYQDKPPPKNAKILDEKTIDKKKPQANSDTSYKPPLRTNTIDVYVTHSCVSCDQIVDKLAELNIAHEARNIEDYRDIQSILIRQTNSLTVPAIFIDDKLVAGVKINTLEATLQDHGYLHPEETESTATDSDSVEAETPAQE